MMRACVLEFAVDREADINLARVLRLIDRAVAEQRVELIVLPSDLDADAPCDADQPFASEPLGTVLLRALGERAARHRVHLVASARHHHGDEHVRVIALIGPDGKVVGSVQSRVDAHADGDADAPEAVVCDSNFGRIGLIAGPSLARFEAARVAVLDGAQLLCAPYGLSALSASDEHPAARALENEVFVLCAAARAPAAEGGASARSRIVGCDGRVLGEAQADSECIVVADLELGATGEQGSVRPLGLRRPELYRGLQSAAEHETAAPSTRRLSVAALSFGTLAGDEALDSAVAALRTAARDGVGLVVLPALLGQSGFELDEPEEAARFASRALRALCEAVAGSPTHVVCSVVEAQREGFAHVGVVLGHAGVVARRLPSHLAPGFAWSQSGRRIDSVTLPWGRLAIALPDELYVPELAALWARAQVDLVAVVELEPSAPAVLARQWAREHGLSVALASRTVTLIEAPQLSVELSLSDDLPQVDAVVRKVRFGEGAARAAVRGGWQRSLWNAPRFTSAPRFTPSLVEAVLAPGLDILRGSPVPTIEVIEVIEGDAEPEARADEAEVRHVDDAPSRDADSE